MKLLIIHALCAQGVFSLPPFWARSVNGLSSGVTLVKRALSWERQINAPEDLISASEYPGADPSQLNDYVYESRSGDDVYIYIIEQGIAVNVKNQDGNNEFPNFVLDPNTNKPKVILTQKAQAEGKDPFTDEDPGSHGTIVASKAAGAKFGTAKKAKLISVKYSETTEDALEGLQDVIEEIRGFDEARKRKCVISISATYPGAIDHDTAKNDEVGKYFNDVLGDLFDEGVPVVMGSGNRGTDDPPRPNIDTIPQVLEDADTPIINVGASRLDGSRAPLTQAGPQLTVYAPGDPAAGQTRDDGKAVTASGTSIAAPAVAGIIATYMAYDTPPWDNNAQGRDRVKAIKEFIKSPASSHARRGNDGVNVIWNGADEEAHRSAGANCPAEGNQKRQDCGGGDGGNGGGNEPPPDKTCTDLNKNPKKFIHRRDIMPALVGEENSFCKTAADQGKLDDNSGSISRKLFEGTPAEIDVAMDWQPGLDFKPDFPKCVEIMNELIDGCDTMSGDWKAGGVRIDGDVKYRWNPTKERQNPWNEQSTWGHCNSWDNLAHDHHEVWGGGWIDTDYGDALLKAIEKLGLAVTAWTFDYQTGGADKREWTASFNLPDLTPDRVDEAAWNLGLGLDLGCHYV